MNEYFKVLWVRYEPNLQQVQIEGVYTIITAAGKKIQEPQFFMTTQEKLESLKPQGATSWGDSEVSQVVTEKFNIPCIFQDPNDVPPAP